MVEGGSDGWAGTMEGGSDGWAGMTKGGNDGNDGWAGMTGMTYARVGMTEARE